MREELYLEPLKSVPDRSIFQYLQGLQELHLRWPKQFLSTLEFR